MSHSTKYVSQPSKYAIEVAAGVLHSTIPNITLLAADALAEAVINALVSADAVEL